MLTQNKRLRNMLLGVGLLLLLPFLGTLLTEEINWGPLDFILAGSLLLGTALLCELVLRKVRKPDHRMALIALVLAALLIVWAELAVGIIGTPFAGN